MIRGAALAALFALLAAAPVLAGNAFAPGPALPDGRIVSVSPAALEQLGILTAPPVEESTPGWVGAAERLGLPPEVAATFVQKRALAPRVPGGTAARVAAPDGRVIETELVLVRVRDTESPCVRGKRHCTVHLSDGQLCWVVVVAPQAGGRELVLVDANGGGVLFSSPVGS